VARHADWWNVPVHRLDRRTHARPATGGARLSVQVLVTLVTDETRRDETVELAARRFGRMGEDAHVVGDGREVAGRLQDLADEGVERIYTWFTDFAPPATLAAFGAEVVAALR
jgi:alkanesulfonate monooxygenase SsuD/methylene tetrahydromethanopterin reductase-like flavin-dependent oxidoreductase (luciferase family)